MKTKESEPKAKLCETLRKVFPSWEIFRHEDIFTHGIPDISATGNKKTTWIEVKMGPGFKSKGIQEFKLQRLAHAGHAWYVVFWEDKKGRMTYIVAPHLIGKDRSEWQDSAEGFNYDFIIQFLKKVHK